MDKYYIIDSKGKSLFIEPFCKDFCIHCLVMLLDTAPQETFSLLSAGFETYLRREKTNLLMFDLFEISPATETAHRLQLKN